MKKGETKKLNAWARSHSVEVNFHVKMVALLLLIIILPLEQLFSRQMADAEASFIENVQGSNDSSTVNFFRAVDFLGNLWVLMGTATLLFYVQDPLHSTKLNMVACFSVYLCSCINMVLREPRPYFLSRNIQGHQCSDGFGMPSLALTVATVCYSFILIMYIHRRTLWLRFVAYVAALMLMVLLAFAKVYLGANFPHQVVATLVYDYLYITITFTFDSVIHKLAYRSSHNYDKNRQFSVYWFIATLGCVLASLLVYLLFPLHFHLDIEWENNAMHDCNTHQAIIQAAPLFSTCIIFFLLGAVAGNMHTSKLMPQIWWYGPMWKRLVCFAGAMGVEVAIYFTLSEC